MKMKKILNEWKEFLNENEGEDYYVRKMTPADGKEYFTMVMSDGNEYLVEYDTSTKQSVVFDYEYAGQDISEMADDFMRQRSWTYDQERFPEDELDERCQKGYKTHPTRKTKKMYGKTYRNCVKAE